MLFKESPGMHADLEFTPAHPRLIRAVRLWRCFCEQWRHCYLFLAIVLWSAWQVSRMAIPTLERTRFMGGLHPGHVLFLMNVLKIMWLFPLLAATVYALSFVIPRLNAAEAVAVSALCCSAALAWVLILALVRITVN